MQPCEKSRQIVASAEIHGKRQNSRYPLPASSLVIVVDEASDSQDCFVLHVLFVLPVTRSDDDENKMQMQAVTVDLVYLQNTNATNVSQAVTLHCQNTLLTSTKLVLS